MSRGGSYGGGRSSLGYLFGNDNQPTKPQIAPAILEPPYGVDVDNNSPVDGNISASASDYPSPSSKRRLANNYPRARGQNSGNFLTDRPSTKVKSAPGGDSSLGYLFGIGTETDK